MSDLVLKDQSLIFDDDQVSIIKNQIFPNATDSELKEFVFRCQASNLDPFKGQITASIYKDENGNRKVVCITTIDGFRSIAERSGCYAGSDDAVFDTEKNPTKATVTVYKMVQGQRVPFTATARWKEYYPGEKKGFMWRKMPCVMLAKCAEALAMRKAFPNETGRIYASEEMEQASRPRVDNIIHVEAIEEASERYTGQREQNEKIKAWCKEYNVPENSKPAIKEAINGKSMEEVHAIVKGFGS